jgi:hypothetical protein
MPSGSAVHASTATHRRTVARINAPTTSRGRVAYSARTDGARLAHRALAQWDAQYADDDPGNSAEWDAEYAAAGRPS